MRAHRLLFLILDFFSLKLVIWKACTHSSRSHASESRIYTHGLFLPRLTCLNTCQGTQSSLEGRRVQGSLGKSVPRKRFSTSCVLDKLCSLLSCNFAWESLSGYKPWGESCYCSCSRRLSSRLSSLPCIEETRQPVSSCISSSMQLSSCCVSVVMSVVSFGCIVVMCDQVWPALRSQHNKNHCLTYSVQHSNITLINSVHQSCLFSANCCLSSWIFHRQLGCLSTLSFYDYYWLSKYCKIILPSYRILVVDPRLRNQLRHPASQVSRDVTLKTTCFDEVSQGKLLSTRQHGKSTGHVSVCGEGIKRVHIDYSGWHFFAQDFHWWRSI